MDLIRRICSGALVLFLLLPGMVINAGAVEEGQAQIQQILGYMLEERSEADMERPLNALKDTNPVQGGIWEQIIRDWHYVNEEMEIHRKVLPDGLPQDDSMAIVVMGYQLNRNGSVKPELLDRLSVAIRSARKYPNAYIICTGGATSDHDSITEAGEMAAWLKICGIEESRIIIEDASYSTTENARNTCEILRNGYDSIKYLAIVTSDYHIRRSCLMFEAAALYAAEAGEAPLEVIGNAVCAVDNSREESVRTKVWGLAILAGVDMPE